MWPARPPIDHHSNDIMKPETPPTLSARRATVWKPLGISIVMMIAATASASAGRAITAITPRDVDYVLDADARNSTRDYNLVKGTVTVEYSNLTSAQNTRLSVGLRDENDNWVTLVGGTNLTTTFNPGVVGATPVSHAFDFALDPEQQLDPGREYRIGASVQVYQQHGGFWTWTSFQLPV